MERNRFVTDFVTYAVEEVGKMLPDILMDYHMENLGCKQVQEIISYILQSYPKVMQNRWILHCIPKMASIAKDTSVEFRDDVKVYLQYALLESERKTECHVEWLDEKDLEDILGMMLFSYNAELSKDEELLRGVVLLVKRKR